MEFQTEVNLTSPFLRLPAELRSKIYSALLGGNVIHIGGTGHQPFAEGHLPNGRCCSCTAALSDGDCFAKYTLQQKPLKGALPPDRFSRRHRDCHRYPVSHRLRLDILLVCRQIYQEAASLVFEENTFTLCRPYSVGPFLTRLNSAQLKAIRTMAVYSVESLATWIGPFDDSDLTSYLTGLLRLQVFIELKYHYGGQFHPSQVLKISETQDRRMSGLTMFRLPQLSQVDVMILAPEDPDAESDELDSFTLEGLRAWETRLRQMLLPS